MSSKFCIGVTKVIIKGLEAGHTRTSVCKKAGISLPTLSKWLKDEAKAEFAADVEMAEAVGTTNLVEQIKFHSQKDWRAAAWILERTRDEFRASSRSSASHRSRMDALAQEKLQADIEFTKAKTEALKSSELSPEDIGRILGKAAERRDSEEDSVH